MADSQRSGPLRLGLVGPGRTRNGLAPYLARDLERAGASVVAANGRDAERCRAACAALGDALGHPVAAAPSLAALVGDHGLDGLVVAAPIPAHLPALRAALEAGLHVLCEKPLVAPEEHDAVPALVAEFVERGLVLMENCQLPYVVGPAFEGVHPGLLGAAAQRFEMHMAPTGCGVAMLVDTVSHFLSVLQAVLPIAATARAVAVRVEVAEPREAAEAARVDLELETPFPRVVASLYLRRCAEQPRPQWFALDGVRVERRIDMRDYSMSYCGVDAAGTERCVAVQDPLAALTQAFVAALREPDLERIRATADAVLARARLYQCVLGAWRQA